MSETQLPDEFAFGLNEVSDCSCPALAAGYNPEGTGSDYTPGLLEAAETYDDEVRMQLQPEGHSGTIDAGVAESMWVRTIEHLQREYGEDDGRTQAAEKVAKELGWLDE